MLSNLTSNSCDVSVVLPFHNVNDYLFQAVESVIRDREVLREVLLVADRIDLSTINDLKRHYADEPVVRVILSSGVGIVDALNEGIRAATGTYIARMDGDDITLLGRFKAQRDYLASHPKVAVVGSAIELICPHGEQISTRRFPKIVQSRFGRSPIQPQIAHPASMIKKNVLIELGGYRNHYPHAEDQDLWSRVMDKWIIANLRTVYLRYRVHPQQISQVKKTEQRTSTWLIAAETAMRRNSGTNLVPEFRQEPVDDLNLSDIISALPPAVRRSVKHQIDVYNLSVELSHARASLLMLIKETSRAFVTNPIALGQVIMRHGVHAIKAGKGSRLSCSICDS